MILLLRQALLLLYYLQDLLNFGLLNGEKRYVFTYEYADNSYKIIATPTVNQDANSGKLLLSFNGNKYEKKWDKNNDNSYSEDW